MKKNFVGFGFIFNYVIIEFICFIGIIIILWLRLNFRNIEMNINDGICFGFRYVDYKKVI